MELNTTTNIYGTINLPFQGEITGVASFTQGVAIGLK
jgi:hypothetical protein